MSLDNKIDFKMRYHVRFYLNKWLSYMDSAFTMFLWDFIQYGRQTLDDLKAVSAVFVVQLKLKIHPFYFLLATLVNNN